MLSYRQRGVDGHIVFPESDRFTGAMVYLVPPSEAYPEDVRYSIQYGASDGTTILRYGNAHGSTKGHERQTPEGIEEMECITWRDLPARFRQEVVEYERQHDD